MIKWDLYRDERMVHHTRINVIKHIGKMKDKNHPSKGTEKAFNKIQHSFTIKLENLGIYG